MIGHHWGVAPSAAPSSALSAALSAAGGDDSLQPISSGASGWRARFTLSCGFVLLLVCFGVSMAALAFSDKPSLYGSAVFSRVFTDKDGRLLRIVLTPDEKYRVFEPLSRIPSEMREATLLYEDRAFYRHPGVNPLSMGRAVLSMAGGGRRMGGSTITMQLARLTQGLETTTVIGKLRQIWRALVLEWHYSKDEILEAYLNLAPYGGNIEGVGAAARVWFHKPVEQLTLPEVLALVPVPQNPTVRHPLNQSEKQSDSGLSAARQRLDDMWREHSHQGGLGADESGGDAMSVFSRVPLQVFRTTELPSEAPHAVNAVLKTMNAAGELASTPTRLTLSLPVQKSVENAISRHVARGSAWGMRNASALLLDWRSGEIRALVGSANFYNAAIEGQVDGTAARRSPGSTLKPFVYALALQQGLIHPQTLLSDTPRTFRGYEPENSDGGFHGPLSARQALIGSRNIPAIALANQLKYPDLYSFLRDGGVQFSKGADHYGLALVLGGAEVTMRELAGLYAALPSRGLWREPVLLARAHPEDGLRRILSAEAAFVALDMIRAQYPAQDPDVRVYWKTGTSNGLRDAWTAGVFGPYVLVVWVGSFDNASNPGFTGLGAAAPLFFDIVRAVRGREPLPDLARENLDELRLVHLPVCAATGDVNTALCANTPGGVTETWFIPGVSPIQDSGVLREILVDTQTGLRQCRDIAGITERQVWEFWPADLRRLYRQAGVSKPSPPAFAPECLEPGTANLGGKVPIIVSPRPGMVYSRRLSVPEHARESAVPLLADVDADADSVFWFADSTFLGQSSPYDGVVPAGEGSGVLFWTPKPGISTLRAVDNLGRATSLRVEVETVP